jgi:hypothetical protein
MWAQDEPDSKENTLDFLRQFSAQLAHDLQQESGDQPHHRLGNTVSKQKLSELSKLLARCYFKQGEWQAQLNDSWSSVSATYTSPYSLVHKSFRETQKTSFILISSPLITIQYGIKLGIHGHLPTLKL